MTVGQLDSTLYDAFGQRQVSTIYNALNQYHVVMEVAPRYWQSPATLRGTVRQQSGGAASGTQTTQLPDDERTAQSTAGASATAPSDSVQERADQRHRQHRTRGAVSSGAAVSASVETMVPLAAVSSHTGRAPRRLAVNHHGLFVSTTISFNLQPGMSLSPTPPVRSRRRWRRFICRHRSTGSFAGTRRHLPAIPVERTCC